MNRIPAMVDMRLTDEDRKKEGYGGPCGPCDSDGGPVYPYGLCISLTQVELDKLGLTDDVTVGDMLHIHGMAKVTSVSMSDSENYGPSRRVELQIVSMVGEDEDQENEDVTPAATRRTRLYG